MCCYWLILTEITFFGLFNSIKRLRIRVEEMIMCNLINERNYSKKSKKIPFFVFELII
jgi:hypothetical protein